jgi:hypothetical protein
MIVRKRRERNTKKVQRLGGENREIYTGRGPAKASIPRPHGQEKKSEKRKKKA